MSEEGAWLSLIEYRNKHKVSISTLRRRVRDNSIRYQLVRGKYFIFDPSEQAKESRDSAAPPDTRTVLEPSSDHRLLLAELKGAYQQILREKEEQILLLKEEIANLGTLVRVLEGARTKNAYNTQD